MSTVTGVSPVAGAAYAPSSAGAALTVSGALAALRQQPGASVEVADSLDNIQKNLDALQAVAGRITRLSSTDGRQTLQVAAAQYPRTGAILARWAAQDGQKVEVTGVAAARAAALAAARPDYVSTITVADTSGNLQRSLGDLQTLAAAGTLRRIVQTGTPAALRMTAEQLAASGDALAAIRNQAYTLAITRASVSDTLGLDGKVALTANARIKSIDVRDGTDAIEANLDALQRVGLRLRSLTQTDADNTLTVTGAQYRQNALTIGKIITPYQLDVIRASAAQAALLAGNQKVVTVSVVDTAANIGRQWSLMQRLADGLTAVEVSDSANAVRVSAEQLAASQTLLSRFTDGAAGPARLAVTGVTAAQAATVAAQDRVASVGVADTADNVTAALDTLQDVAAAGRLRGIVLTGRTVTLSMDASRLLGDAGAATRSVLDKVKGASYSLAVTGAALADLDALAADARVVSLDVSGSSDEIEGQLNRLHQLGRRVVRIQQTDAGEALDVSQAAYESRSSVLSRIAGGYSLRLTGVAASKALAYASDTRVTSLTVTDSGRNLAANWGTLRSLGSVLERVVKSDDGALSLNAGQYRGAVDDGLTGRFDAGQRYAVTGASVAQAAQLAGDEAVERFDVADDGAAVVEGMTDLAAALAGGKLRSIVLDTGATGLTLDASQYAAAEGLLAIVKGGRYSVALQQVDVADARALAAGNARIASLAVKGDAGSIAAHLDDLASLGHRLLSVEQSDAADAALTLSGAAYEQHRAMLDKLVGGYRAVLTDVSAARAASLADDSPVQSLQVSDGATQLSAAWTTLGGLGDKLAGITQSDAALLRLTAAQWAAAPALVERFAAAPGVVVSGVNVDALATLADQGAVQEIQLRDSAEALGAAWATLLAEPRLTQLEVTDPANPLALTAGDYTASADLLGKVKADSYRLALSGVAAADAATLAADTHVSALAVTASAEDIGTHFGTLAGLAVLDRITLGDEGGTLALTGAQLLAGSGTLAKIDNAYRIAASEVSLADLAAVQAVGEVATLAVSDTADNVAVRLDDLVAMGDSLTSLHLTDANPVLALTQQAWNASAAMRARIDGAFQADLSQVQADAVAALADDASVRSLAVADNAGNLATHWDALVAAYNAGSGALTALSLTDGDSLTLSADQQAAGAAMIAALLPDATIVTAG